MLNILKLTIFYILLNSELKESQPLSELKLMLTRKECIFRLILKPREFRLPPPDLSSLNLNAQLSLKNLKPIKLTKKNCKTLESSMKRWLSLKVSSDLLKAPKLSLLVRMVSYCSISSMIHLTTLEIEISKKNEKESNYIKR